MQGSPISQEKLRRLQALAEAQGQSLDAWIDHVTATVSRPTAASPRGPMVTAACPLVSLVHDFFVRLCQGRSDLVLIANALRAAAVDGEGSRLGPLKCDGMMLELDPQHDGVRISGGGGRFTLTNAAALELADRLASRRWAPSLVA
jgi:hypothetical protein